MWSGSVRILHGIAGSICLLLQDDAFKWPLEAAKLSVPSALSLLPVLYSQCGGQPTNIGRPLDQGFLSHSPSPGRRSVAIDAGLPVVPDSLAAAAAASELCLSHFKCDDGVERR